MTLRHLLAIGWTLGILAACSIPGSSVPSVSFFEADKFGHFGLFFGLGWLWMWALRLPLGKRTWAVLIGGIAYAGLTEIYQGLLPFERTPDLFDALANTLGLLASVGVFRFWRARTER